MGKEIEVLSPNGQLKMSVNVNQNISYKVAFKGKEIISPSIIDLQVQDKKFVAAPKIIDIQKKNSREEVVPLYGKFKTLQNNYNELLIKFDQNFALQLRAYNEGVAYRYITYIDDEIIVKNEIFNVKIKGNPAVIFPEATNYTSWELMYIDYAHASSIPNGNKAVTPVLFSMDNGTKVVVAESDVRDYPGMYLEKNGDGFTSNFAHYPDSTAIGSWGFVSVVQRYRDYIAKTNGKRSFPWRIIIATDDDKSLLSNEIIYLLAKPSELTNTTWIKPGKAVWEWWHDAILTDSIIPSGRKNKNTELYKYYIDFAAENKIEYLMIDAGWSNIFDLSQVRPTINIQEIINYGKAKKVGVFLWCSAMSLTDRDEEFLEMMHKWGAVGIKVDFFDRDDQLAMDWYETIARKAAKYELMVNYHGCSKPTGLQRTYPNIVNFEALRGNECNKWDLTANPKHHVTFPFTRMLGGPVDYTPGALRNRSQQTFKPVEFGLPSAMGTRCHEMAMFVIYDQYLAMLCDSPDEYRKFPDVLNFLSTIPVVFDNTKVLDAAVGEYILTAKQKGNIWYVGGMTNWTARDVKIDFSFLPKNVNYTAEIFKDGKDANLWADRYIFETQKVNSDSIMQVKMAAGGGIVMKIYPEK